MNSPQSLVFKERLTDLFNYVQQSLSFVEAKNGALTALNSGLIFGALRLYQDGQNIWLYVGFLLPVITSLGFAALSFYPIKRNKKVKKKAKEILSKNLFNCENISQLSLEGLKKQLTDGEEISSFEIHKIDYLHRTSFVIGRKYKMFRVALICLFFSPFGLLIGYLPELICKKP